MHEIESYEHEGVKVVIHADPEPSNPRTEFDHLTTFVAWHRRTDLGDEGFNYRDLPEFGRVEDLVRWLQTEHGAVLVAPLYCYEHGGIAVSLGQFYDPWDSGQCGFVFMTQEQADQVPDPLATMAGEVEEFNQYLTGDVYGYVVGEGEHEESVWGFYGLDHAKEEAESAASSLAERTSKLERLLAKEGEHIYVSRYNVDRCYGGPEEGGWWYDWSTFEAVVATRESEEAAIELARQLNEAQRADDREHRKHDRFQSIGTADTVYMMERQPAECQSTERPHYE